MTDDVLNNHEVVDLHVLRKLRSSSIGPGLTVSPL